LRISTPQLGMILALVAIGALFLASLVAYWATWAAHPDWASVRLVLPKGLFAATLLLVGVSASLERALRQIKRNDQDGLKHGLLLTGVFALAFLLGQAFNWSDVMRLNPAIQTQGLALFSFYLLTGVHAIHVVAGFLPLVWVYVRARQREYSSSRYEGVKLCTQYWHFLGVIWLVLLGTLYAI
jgi:cytochrome c oxidase subunit III